ncbi:hypothetical protein Misp01_70750 [Microtetraspora sp. NBRC 13810]|nr:hypothetical protein Misp01_70750 [Microtetraspora sp. NBRC 13810]
MAEAVAEVAAEAGTTAAKASAATAEAATATGMNRINGAFQAYTRKGCPKYLKTLYIRLPKDEPDMTNIRPTGTT